MFRSDASFPEPESWNGAPEREDDPGTVKRGPTYVCVDCVWRGRDALGHYVATGHAVRGANWSRTMGNCQWTDSDADGRRKA